MVFCATCNEHSLRRHEENRCQRWYSAVSCCCYCAPPQAATPPCCRHCCHCLIRGSSGGAAGVAACGGGSGSSSGSGGSGGSGTILFLVVVIILLLFAHPPCRHRPSPFCRPLLCPQAAARPPSTRNGWLLFALVQCPLCRRPPSSNR